MISTNVSRWIIRPQPNPEAKLRLFCFSHAGGTANDFRTWPNHLPIDIELCAIELPGRGGRIQEPLIGCLDSLVQSVATDLLAELERPFAFFGHSMGALLAFELSRHLRRHNHPTPQLLAVSGYRAPQLPPPPHLVHKMSPPEFLAEMQRLGGTPPAVFENAEIQQLFFPIIRADFAAIETYTYTPEPPLDCPIAAYAGLQDTEVTPNQLKAWQHQTSQTFSAEFFTGEHFYLNHSPELLLEGLNRVLAC